MGLIASAAPKLLTDVAAIVGALTVIAGGTATLAHLPPWRWLIDRLIIDPFSKWFRSEVADAVEDISQSTKDTAHLVQYHLGSNDTTMPWHERLSRLELKHGLEPVQQQEGH